MTVEKPVAYRTRESAWLCAACWTTTEVPAIPYYAADVVDAGGFVCMGCGTEGSESDAQEPCVFCEIIAGREPVQWVLQPDYWPDTVAFIPLNPVTEGHTLIVPKVHVRDFAEDPEVYAVTSGRAAELMQFTPRAMNVITSRGRVATQSIFHLHLHLVPRRDNDGLALPWYSGRRKRV